MTARSPMLVGLWALLMATIAPAMGSLPPPAGGPAQGAGTEETPFACALAVREEEGGVALRGEVEAREPVSGTYALSIRAGGGATSIEQSGDFAAGAGETVTLGEATLSGPASAVDATLALTAGGRTVACPRLAS